MSLDYNCITLILCYKALAFQVRIIQGHCYLVMTGGCFRAKSVIYGTCTKVSLLQSKLDYNLNNHFHLSCFFCHPGRNGISSRITVPVKGPIGNQLFKRETEVSFPKWLLTISNLNLFQQHWDTLEKCVQKHPPTSVFKWFMRTFTTCLAFNYAFGYISVDLLKACLIIWQSLSRPKKWQHVYNHVFLIQWHFTEYFCVTVAFLKFQLSNTLFLYKTIF